MPKPSLFVSVSESGVERQLLESDVTKLFLTKCSSSPSSWVDTLIADQYDVAMVQVDALSETDCNKLIASKLLERIDIIFISNGAPNEYVDKAMHHGVSYHLRMPINFSFVQELLGELHTELEQHKAETKPALSSNLDQFGLLVGSSPVMRKMYRVIRKAALSQANVFIIGESGSGKELVAHTVHLTGPHCNAPFIAVNCGALSPELIESELFGHVKGAFTGAHRDRIGVFEQAEGGTLFLDEVTEMPMEHQVKLLRVLETGEYKPVGGDVTKIANVRVISATNREPVQAIQNDLFREDLYFRLAHFPIRVPPLRDRGDDISGLAKHFLAYRNAEEGLAKEINIGALKKIGEHQWPGNVRELRHAVERAFVLANEEIDESHIIVENTMELDGPEKNETLPAGIPLEEVEKGVILKTLAANDGNKTETANQLGVSIKTLYNKLEKYETVEKARLHTERC